MESTKRVVVKEKALVKSKRPASRNRVKSQIGKDMFRILKFGGDLARFLLRRARNRILLRRRKVPNFKSSVIVLQLVHRLHRLVNAPSPNKPSPKLAAPPVDVKLVDKIIDELPKSTRSAMSALPSRLVEEGLDTEAPVIDMKDCLVHGNSVLHKGRNGKWIVTNRDAIQLR